MEATCETCRFWDEDDSANETGVDGNGRYCRRMSPQPTGALGAAFCELIQDGRYKNMTLSAILTTPLGELRELDTYANNRAWPLTYSWDWCGEHQPRETEPSDA